MASSLADRYGISSYSGQSPEGYVRMSLTPEGLYAFILGESGTLAIEPLPGETEKYRAYRSVVQPDAEGALATCGTDVSQLVNEPHQPHQRGTIGGELKDYRLALATSAEYSIYHGGTLPSVMNALTVAMTYINGILERDVSIRLSMIANNDAIIFFDPDTDPYTYNALGANLGENQAALTSIIGLSNFDIGHVFTQVTPPPGGSYTAGIASLASVCATNRKGNGASSQPAPIGESFYQIAAHEIGHQFIAGHTWNANAGSCTGGQYSGSTAWEPGSGSTIMSYVGVCGPHNITTQRDGYFNGGTIEQMYDFSRGAGNCGNTITLGNQAPVIVMPEHGKTLPFLTPFALTGNATDPDGDGLSYCWEQHDLGPAGDPRTPFSSAPLFRSWLPTNSPTRYFPRLPNLVNNTSTLGEYIPDYSRDMTFRLTVRDNHPGGGGGIEWEDVTMAVTDLAGPFVVSSPNLNSDRWTIGSVEELRWDVASTDLAPVNCQAVDVLLSVDGGFTYPYLLAEQTPNDGQTEVVVPDVPSVQARVMVRASDNFFFDISDENFVIEAATAPDYEVYVVDRANQLCPGDSVVFPLVILAQGGFNEMVSLLVSGVPAGVSVTLSSATAMAGDTVSVTLRAQATAQGGVDDFLLAGNAPGAGTSLRRVRYEVATGENGPLALLSPARGARGTSRFPALTWAAVPAAVSYRLELALTPSFLTPLVSMDGLTQTSYQVSDQLSSEVPYYWRVLAVDVCGDTSTSLTGAFQTGACRRSEALDLPQEISGLGAPQVLNSSILMSLNGPVTDVNVLNVQGQHESIRDLRARLYSPAGTQVNLFSRVCTDADQNFRLSFDDEAEVEIDDVPCPATSGRAYQPDQALATLNSEPAQGQWRLELSDLINFDGGVWYNWELEVCTDLISSPVLIRNEALTIQKGASNILDSALLQITDPGVSATGLIYTVLEAPQHGALRRVATVLRPGGVMDQSQVDRRLIVYAHDGSNVATDSFTFAIQSANGGWSGVYTFHINVDGVSSVAVPTWSEVEVFPVPARDRLFVRLSEPAPVAAELMLYDIQGKLLTTAVLAPGQRSHAWSVSAFPAGLYLLKVKQGGKMRSYKVSLTD
jgi:subtilisin-like proprotein convertase family protein